MTIENFNKETKTFGFQCNISIQMQIVSNEYLKHSFTCTFVFFSLRPQSIVATKTNCICFSSIKIQTLCSDVYEQYDFWTKYKQFS